MKKTSQLTRISLMLALFFGIDKLLGVLRTIIISRQFGLSEELDVFNAANNLPDLLFALISGGALAIAFIPVLSKVLSKNGKKSAWSLFSKVANLAFFVTLGLAIIVGILAGPLVKGQLGIAPGFKPDQQVLAIRFMRLNLISTLIFSISGLVMAGLQANQHFLMPAIAPLVYDIGQIFGALILAPEEGLQIAGYKLPAFGLGIDGLVYGVIIGAALHLIVQIPGLIKFDFKWSPVLDFKDESFRRVLRLMGPRLISMIFIQLIFLARDNLASRLATGSVTALSYGWWIQQVPETLIGTAIATALLPTLSEYVVVKDKDAFRSTIERSLRVMIALSLPITVILSCVRAFYARQNARIPMLISATGFLIYVGLAIPLMGRFASGGIALANSITYSIQAVILIILLNRQLSKNFKLGHAFLRASIGAAAAGLCSWLILTVLPIEIREIYLSFGAILFGGIVAVILIWRDLRLLRRL